MKDKIEAFSNLTTDVFAGIPVRDHEASLAWYERFFGCAPSFLPNDVEAVWQVAERMWIYIIVVPERAGHSIQNVMVSDLDALVSQIADRGIRADKEDLPAEGTRKTIYFDPDGNEFGLIHVATD